MESKPRLKPHLSRVKFAWLKPGVSTVSTIVLLVILACAVSVSLWAGNKKKDKKTAAVPQMNERQRALHALNRLTFGPRPGDVDRVMAIGVDKWIDQQLHPEKIGNAAMESRLEPLRTLRMDPRQLVENFLLRN